MAEATSDTNAIVERAGSAPTERQTNQPVTVLVTGFGPFLDKFPVNSSWTLATLLPSVLLPPENSSASQPQVPVRIITHPHNLEVSYPAVLRELPQIYDTYTAPKPDIILHIGLAAGRKYFAIERGARGSVYTKAKGVDGVVLSKEELQSLFGDVPEKLTTGFLPEDVLERWIAFAKDDEGLGVITAPEAPAKEGGGTKSEDVKMKPKDKPEDEKKAPPDLKQVDEANQGAEPKKSKQPVEPDLRISPDAGNYLCAFTFFNSLARCYRKDAEGERPVIFYHVPDLSSKAEDVQTGLKVTRALIRALVASYLENGTRNWK